MCVCSSGKAEGLVVNNSNPISRTFRIYTYIYNYLCGKSVQVRRGYNDFYNNERLSDYDGD